MTEEDRQRFKITFGKHNGKTIDDVPNSYLEFIIKYFKECKALIAAENELRWRKHHDIVIEDD